jgi:hypothetical protein
LDAFLKETVGWARRRDALMRAQSKVLSSWMLASAAGGNFTSKQ